MYLTAFRVLNYRCVNDSGWIELDRLTVLVGKNQSGKTALLRALHKFNPFQSAPYNPDREWPRGRRKERDPKAPAVKVRFALTEEEKRILSELAGVGVEGPIEISRSYDGQLSFKLPDASKADEARAEHLLGKLVGLRELPSAECSEAFSRGVRTYLDELSDLVRQQELSALRQAISGVMQRLGPLVSAEDVEAPADQPVLQELVRGLDTLLPDANSTQDLLEEQVRTWLPVFVYMDDFRRYSGSCLLNQLKERRDSGRLTNEDETVLILMGMAGLDLDDQVAKVASDDREQRALDLNDASITLTRDMAGRWSQEEYVVEFHADQHHFFTFVKSPDQDQTALVPLEEESKGFQWFFSFDIHFAHETRGTLKGAVILLDEPGLHLHPKAQDDLLKRLEAYCAGNQLIYTTHLPFMIDLTRPERIRVVDRTPNGTVVTDDIFGSDKDARFSLLAKLGMSASQSLLVGRYNLVVEGPEDYWFVLGMSEVMKRGGRDGLADRLAITAAGGASEAAYMATFMCGQDLNVVVLFDSDQAGETAAEGLAGC